MDNNEKYESGFVDLLNIIGWIMLIANCIYVGVLSQEGFYFVYLQFPLYSLSIFIPAKIISLLHRISVDIKEKNN